MSTDFRKVPCLFYQNIKTQSLQAKLQSSQLIIKKMSLPRLCVPCRVILGFPLVSFSRGAAGAGLGVLILWSTVTASVPVS